jgi:lipid-A-disaccharide synthase
VLYYISPTVWAWRKGRLKTIKRTVDKMLLIFPFEEEIYKTHGIPAAYIGHPLRERVRVTLSKEDFFQKYGLGFQKKFITLLPGSRKSELRYHMPVLAKTIQQIKKEIPAHFILVLAEGLAGHSLSRYFPTASDHLTILTEDNYEAMAYSDLVLSSCGTANLETALLETPLISFYRLSPFTYYAGIRFIKIRNYSIVNILAGKKVVPELIQKNFSPENICTEAKRILDSEEARLEMISNFRKIKELLGEKKASQNAARELEELIRENP